MRNPRSTILCTGLLAAAACGRSVGDESVQQLRLASSPTVQIGAVEGDSAYLFQSVRTAHFASAGRIVVADAGLKVLRVFDSHGQFVRQIGGAGEGPGEFLALRDAWMVSPDTIGVWDSRSKRLTYFTVDGDLIGTANVRPGSKVPASLDFLAGSLSDHSVIIGAVAVGSGPDQDAQADEVHLVHFDQDGAYLGTVAMVRGLVRVQLGRSFGPMPFSPFPYAAVLHDSLVYTDGMAPSVFIRDLDWRGREVSLPPVREDADSAWAVLRAQLAAGNDWQLPLLAEARHSDSIPYLAGLLVDDDGAIWTKRFVTGTDALWLRFRGQVRGGSWWVVTPEAGVFEVEVPSSFRPMEVREGRVLGVQTDSLGVERVAVFPMDEQPS
jgi:hypothetical protein